MTATPLADSDALLWRTRRVVAKAQSIAAASVEAKKIMLLAADLRVLIGQLKARVTQLSVDREVAMRRQSAMTAYRRCFNLRRR